MGAIDSKDSKNPLEHILGLFADVRGGEGATVLLLALNVFLVLLAYYIMKTVREPLILVGGGAEVKSYSSAGQAMLLLGAVPLYGALAGRLSRKRLINFVTLFFIACIVVFCILYRLRVPFLGVAFYLWVGIFSGMVIAQFWSFANDIYTPEAGKRVFAIIAFGASLGAVLGGQAANRLTDRFGKDALPVVLLLLVAAGLLVLSLVITNLIDSRERRKAVTRAPVQAKEAEEPIGKGGAFRMILSSRYLLLIALLMMFLNWVNTTGEYILSRTVGSAAKEAVRSDAAGEFTADELNKATAVIDEEELSQDEYNEAYAAATAAIDAGQSSEEEYKNRVDDHIRKERIANYIYKQRSGRFIGKFYGDFFSVVNLVSLIMQLFLVSRILKYLGVRIALLILPVIAFGGYALIILVPVLSTIRVAKTAENSTDYSLQNTVRQVLFLPLTREQKYKAKQATDTFFVRAGDLLQAVLVFVGVRLSFETKHFALVNLILVVVWIALAIMIGRENRKLTADSE
ncbi:NTP/NDP exchange transporter [Candidatus Poribacteria bacterium]